MAQAQSSNFLNTSSEDFGVDTESRHIESRSPTILTTHRASQGSKADGESSDKGYNSSPASSPGTTFAHDCNAGLPTGYFIFPDPLSPGRGVDGNPESIETDPTTSSENEECITEDKPAAQLENKPPLINVSRENAAEQDLALSVNNETKQFLPLLKDEPNYPRNPTLNPGLEKINKRLRSVTTNLEDRSTPSNGANPISGVHPAFRQTESQPSIDNKALEALKAEVKQLKADFKVLERSLTSKNSRQAEAIRRLERNEERLVRGWERMRDELFRLKAMQERLRGRANMQHDVEGRWQRER